MQMTYYKLTNWNEYNHGSFLKDGFFVIKNFDDKIQIDNFDHAKNYGHGGIFFRDITNILDDLYCRDNYYLRHIHLPITHPKFKLISNISGEYWSNMVILGKRMDLTKIETFEYLESLGADINVGNYRAFNWACRGGHLEIVKHLFNKGTNVSCCNSQSFNDAIRYGKYEVVEFLIDHGMTIISYCFSVACESGRINMVKLLVNKGVDYKPNIDYCFNIVCFYGNLELVKYLITLGVDISRDDYKAMRMAHCNEQVNVVDYLLSIGADKDFLQSSYDEYDDVYNF
ncbi:ankyrin repeat protein [Cotonvirus japonicus]|uniref:Ankyrin repeat protein n=1 Tax=Cotonvirus japonicus TaxID=2811091 RepID=A0ABM7NTV5_9VIRU|nr:ankyrin repeat protein [Cotonvirus japonicus]BCS83594.1 ankyrin repeat protein [Cotonvirus japonicus]